MFFFLLLKPIREPSHAEGPHLFRSQQDVEDEVNMQIHAPLPRQGVRAIKRNLLFGNRVGFLDPLDLRLHVMAQSMA